MIINNDRKSLNAMDMQKHATLRELALRKTQNHILLTTRMKFINFYLKRVTGSWFMEKLLEY